MLLPKNSKHTVRVNLKGLYKTKVAETIIPSHPSFCNPGKPPSALLVISLPNPFFRISSPESIMVFTTLFFFITSNSTTSSGNIFLYRCLTLFTVISSPLWSTISNDSTLSIQVPHITHFLPPAFSAMLPPMVHAHAEVGSVAKI